MNYFQPSVFPFKLDYSSGKEIYAGYFWADARKNLLEAFEGGVLLTANDHGNIPTDFQSTDKLYLVYFKRPRYFETNDQNQFLSWFNRREGENRNRRERWFPSEAVCPLLFQGTQALLLNKILPGYGE